jgi:peptidoglycan/LPS O-acetylase OafA/YrhL
MPDGSARLAVDDRPKLETLDGLRGFAALIVFVSHAANAGLLPAVLGGGFGQVGVMLFFILSGFLMAYLYIDRPVTRANVQRFALARVARVLPLYFCVVILSTLIGNLLYSSFRYQIHSARVFEEHVFLYRGQQELWTIPVEMQFYAIFVGLWFVSARLFARRRSGLLLLAVGIIVPMALLFSPPLAHHLPDHSLPFFMHAFMIGVLIGYGYVHAPVSFGRFLTTLGRVGFLLFVLILFDLPQLLGLSTDMWHGIWMNPTTLIITTLFFLGALAGRAPFTLFATRPARFLGSVSYAFYLFHRPILDGLIDLLGLDQEAAGPVIHLVLFAGSFVSTLALATLSSRFFETPIQERARGWRWPVLAVD